MKDLADHVGVSRQLVSLVLRDQPGPSAETRRRVQAAAEELGYHPDASARLLRGRRSFRLGVLFTMHEPFEVDLVEALLVDAAERGYSLVLGPLGPSRPQRSVIADLLGQRIEGLVVLAADSGAATIDGLPARVPAVQLGGPRSLDPVDDVRVDSAIGIELLVEHLGGLGHERIAYITGGEGPNAADRRDAYLEALRRRSLTPDVIESAFTEEGGSAAAEALLAREALPTAIMAANDRTAAGVIATLVRRGVLVPEDVSVVGFDDSSIAALPYVGLTTVRHDPRALAAQALDAVIHRIDEPDAPIVARRDAPELIVRRSTGPARRGEESTASVCKFDRT
jgi:DNA-binding LacI/PurR family transcriptional regulator